MSMYTDILRDCNAENSKRDWTGILELSYVDFDGIEAPIGEPIQG